MPHDVWNQTNEDIMLIVEEHVKILSERLRGIPVYPSVGNHERGPANLYINKFFLREKIVFKTSFSFSDFHQRNKIAL